MLNDSNLKEPKETLDIVSDLDDDETILAEEAARDEEVDLITGGGSDG